MASKWFGVAIGTLLLLLCIATAADAQSKGRLVFVNSKTGAVQWGGIDSLGFFHPSQQGFTPPSLAGVTHLVATDSGILSYKRATGETNIIGIEPAGVFDYFPQSCCSAGWVTITGIGNALFFYDQQQTGAVVLVDNSSCDSCPTLIQTNSLTGLSTFSNVVATDNYLFFYETKSGLFAVGFINRAGLFVETEGATGIPPGYDFVTATGDTIMLYDRRSGKYETGAILFAGTGSDFFNKLSAGSIGPEFTTAVAVNGQLLFYRIGIGSTLIGHIVTSGNPRGFIVTQTPNPQPGWTSIVAAGNFLLFYNSATGQYQTASIDTTGTLATISSDSMDPGYNLVVATKQ